LKITYSFCRDLFTRFLNLIEKVLVIIGISLFAIIIIANGLEIFSRTILDHSYYWVQEFTIVISCYMIFFGAAVLFKRKGNIFVTVIYNFFPEKVQLIISVITDLLTLIFLIVAIKTSYSYLVFVYGGHTQTMKLPFFLVYLPIFLGFSFILLVIIDWFINDMETLLHKHMHTTSNNKAVLSK